MDAPIGEILEIEEITSKGIIAKGAGNSWLFKFIMNHPVGWEPGDEIRISPAPKFTLGTKPGVREEGASARVGVENVTRKSVSISMLFDGAEYAEKSFSPSKEPLLSLTKNIRLDKELTIIAKLPEDVIQASDGTKWQLNRITEVGRRIEWDKGDAIIIKKGVAASDRIVKIINKSKKAHELSATFISED